MRLLITFVFILSALTACTGMAETQPGVTSIPTESPIDQTFTPEATFPPTALPTIGATTLPSTCLDETAAGQIVEGWLSREGYATLQEAWRAFQEKYGEDNLVSSTTDYNNEFAHAVTWQKMLLVGEYPFRIQTDGGNNYGYCAVLVYQGGIGPEVGLGITDVMLNGEWSGYASGLVDSNGATRTYLRERIGKSVTVRYMAAQNPQDAGFVRAGFFSPQSQALWVNSYYTYIPTDLKFLFDRVGQPRGPSIREMMGLASELGGYGVFFEYIVDTIQ